MDLSVSAGVSATLSTSQNGVLALYRSTKSVHNPARAQGIASPSC